ncbi:chemotaxis protein CheW [Acidisoma cellulosilytica]|uniref:Chemotaxis protein CheW n=1 Tax=Acidisoma cellulosilyticum TaxID=2802395 RepID=A0A963Z0W0_9PROT|nr:chemotaxis protein CheW [Acidisoma cellulosilyticum]MCB8879957.1 chemotaxis protein CheW [Acidisoma cellulosilyticum]
MNRQEERANAILDLRTRALAERPGGITIETPKRALIVVTVGASLLGIDIAEVVAAIPFEGCARMPMREPAVLGVIGRGGRFYSVIGMRRMLALSTAEDNATGGPDHLLLLRGGAPHLALAVDRVLGRFDLAGGGGSFDLDGRLVAFFDPETLRSRFGRPAPDAHP